MEIVFSLYQLNESIQHHNWLLYYKLSCLDTPDQNQDQDQDRDINFQDQDKDTSKNLYCRREAARCFVRVCLQLALTVQYLERSLLLLVTCASDLPMRTMEFCYVLFGVPATSLGLHGMV